MRKPAPSATTSRTCSARASGSTTWPSSCAPPSRCAPSKTASSPWACPIASSAARASTSAQEIRDALAYFKVAVSPDNDLAFERIVNVPKRGIGDTSVKRMHQHARAKGTSLHRAAEALALTDELAGQDPQLARRRCSQSFARWRSLVDSLPHTELAEIILDESGYTQMWQNDRSPEAAGPAREPQGARALDGASSRPWRASSSTSRSSWTPMPSRRRTASTS